MHTGSWHPMLDQRSAERIDHFGNQRAQHQRFREHVRSEHKQNEFCRNSWEITQKNSVSTEMFLLVKNANLTHSKDMKSKLFGV